MEKGKYNSIIGMPPHVSQKRMPMKREMRAAQFAPFAALTGYGDIVSETARLTKKKKELDEDEKALIDFKLRKIYNSIKEKPLVNIAYFLPDKLKEGGEVITKKERVLKMNPQLNYLLLEDNTVVPINDIYHVEFV